MAPPPRCAPPASPPHWPPLPSPPSNGAPPPRPSPFPLAHRLPVRPRFAYRPPIGCGGEAGGFPLRGAGIPVRPLADSDSCGGACRNVPAGGATPTRGGREGGSAPGTRPSAPLRPSAWPDRAHRAPPGPEAGVAGLQPREGADPAGVRNPRRSGAAGRCVGRGTGAPPARRLRGHLSSRPGLLDPPVRGKLSGEVFKGVPTRDSMLQQSKKHFPSSSYFCTHKSSNQPV